VAFTITLAFATPQARDAFAEQELPRVHGQPVDQPVDAEGAPPRLAVAVRSPSSAREVCRLVESFLRQRETSARFPQGSRVDLAWIDSNGEEQVGWIAQGSPRDADLLAIQIGAAAKAVLDKEKAQAAEQPAVGPVA
jgi:hypothetical protein